ncbi:MAG: MFS transporter [Rhodoluna sp.]
MSIKSTRSREVQLRLLVTFFVQGIVSTTTIPRIPELIDQIGVNFTAWGAILGFAGLGSLIGLMLANRLIVRFSSRRVLQVSSILSALLIALLPWISDPWIFFALQALMAFVGSCLNISLNSQSVVFQKLINRTIIGRLHGAWSIGAATSVALSAVLASFMPLWLHFTLIPGLVALVFVWSTRAALSREEVSRANERKHMKKSSFFKSPREIWLLAAGLFAGMFPELVMMDWSTVFSKKVLLLSPGLGAIPYMVFVGAMIVVRLSTVRLTKRRPIIRIANIGGLFGSVAMGLGVILGPIASQADPIFGLVVTSFFWMIAGLGIGPMVPTFFGTAGGVKGLTTPQALARMSLTNSILVMAAKTVMGALAQDINLQVAFIFPTILLFVAGLIAGQVAKRPIASPAVVDDAFPVTGPVGTIAVED